MTKFFIVLDSCINIHHHRFAGIVQELKKTMLFFYRSHLSSLQNSLLYLVQFQKLLEHITAEQATKLKGCILTRLIDAFGFP